MTPVHVAPTGDYLTTEEVACHIRGTSQHVRQLIKSGRLAAIDIAKSGDGRPRFRIAKSELDRFLREAAVAPATSEEVA
ncbi:helix-turn-helix domain-containing protein [Streptomyces huasconensis]|uniref:Helix-turn-helix domain-containing protein n=1 Tax=Streptomyces huasconensis TaxID=1854574 RepID=A0ABV3M4Q6_9ACTN